MLPRHSALSELSLIDPTLPSPSAPPDHQDLPRITPHLQDDTTSVIIGAGLPPVPGRLVKRIREGRFIEMGELLLERLGMAAVNFEVEGSKNPKGKCKPVTNILEWLQCFGLYVAILSQSEPERVPDLQGYQELIIQASMEYDRVFRLSATSQKGISWSSTDTTLWSVAFSGKSKTGRCSQCFSLTHSSAECGWSSETHSSKPPLAVFPSPPRCFGQYAMNGTAPPHPIAHIHTVNISTNAQYAFVIHGYRKFTIKQSTTLTVLTIRYHNLSQEYSRPIKKAIPATASVNQDKFSRNIYA